jgi:hypothetical protein
MRLVRSAAHKEGDVTLGQVRLDVREALVEEGVVAKIGVREVRDGGEVHDQRQTEQVCNMDCHIHRVIVDTALCPLHPVDDALACRVGYAASTYGYPRIVSQSDKLGRQFAVDLLAGHPTSVEEKILFKRYRIERRGKRIIGKTGYAF